MPGNCECAVPSRDESQSKGFGLSIFKIRKSRVHLFPWKCSIRWREGEKGVEGAAQEVGRQRALGKGRGCGREWQPPAWQHGGPPWPLHCPHRRWPADSTEPQSSLSAGTGACSLRHLVCRTSRTPHSASARRSSRLPRTSRVPLSGRGVCIVCLPEVT